MGRCDGHQHTHLCHLMGVLLCLLFHVHIHACHQGDLQSLPDDHNHSQALYSNGTDPGLRDNALYNNTVAGATLNRVFRNLFLKYGNGESLSFEAFEHMLENIGLADLHIHDHKVERHLVEGKFKEFHSHHNHTHGEEDKKGSEEGLPKKNMTAVSLVRKGQHEKRHKKHKDRQSRSTSELLEALDLHKCLATSELLESFGLEENSVVDRDAFMMICPALIFQLDNNACLDSHIDLCPHSDDHDEAHHHSDSEDEENVTKEKVLWISSSTVWGYSFLSVLIISLVGLLSVAVIPLTKKVFYNHLLQFLVALAVGSLTGDACLHLIPHAISPHGHSDSGHSSHSHNPDEQESFMESKDAVWKGLAALAGIYFFFLMERVMGMITERKRKKNKIKRDKSPQGYKQVRDKETEIGAKLSSHSAKVMSCEEMLMVVHPGKDLRHLAEDVRDEVHENCDLDDLDNSNVQGHGHGHSHGPLPSSVSSVAWMVIMGDGLHNFSDGLAIGAAFANSLSGGVSTSVAVFCHELPHELGDFAVLLRAGMPAKQAIVYNLLSSVLCLFGMVVGVLVGNLSTASLWIFAIIGGMFIYVALVDMLPEMTAVDPKAGENPLLHLLLQNLGMLTGTGIMLVIALFEERIQIPHWEP